MIQFQGQGFADCEASYEDARFVIFGAPFDGTTSYKPGTRFGPRAIREISYNFEPYIPEYDLDLSTIQVHDMGDLDCGVVPEDVVMLVAELAGKISSDGKIPVMLGGEHTVSIGASRGVRPEVAVICDAHLDLREEYRGSAYNHGCAARRIYEEGVREIAIIGARSGTPDQYEFARTLHLFTADTVRELGITEVVGQLLDFVGKRRLYLSVDADAIDCCLTPGLGTPEPFGLSPLDIRSIVTALAPGSAGFDYVEVCPCDHGQTACVAASLVRLFIAAASAVSTDRYTAPGP